MVGRTRPRPRCRNSASARRRRRGPRPRAARRAPLRPRRGRSCATPCAGPLRRHPRAASRGRGSVGASDKGDRRVAAVAYRPYWGGIGVEMKNWPVIAILGSAQFVMVLDGTVMNVSISTVVEDLDTTVDAMQAAITFYTLTMAAFMLLGAKLGDVWGRRRAFVIGSIIYAIGSLTTALSPNVVGALPRLVDRRGPGRGARHPGDRGPHRRQLRGPGAGRGLRDHRRGVRRSGRGRPAHRRLRHDLPQLALRVRRRGRDHGRSSCCSRDGSPIERAPDRRASTC